jgi:phosphate:Na+ symporter
MIGGGLAVRRSSMAHIIFSLIVGVLGILFLGPLVAASDWVGARLYDPDGVLAMATFSSLFKFTGIIVFYPWLDGFARFIVRISGKGSESAVSRLAPTLSEAGTAVALEAGWRAILEIARSAVNAICRRLAGEFVKYEPRVEAVQQTEQFLQSLSIETTDVRTLGPRLVRLVHALDHLSQLNDDLKRIPPVLNDVPAPAGFEAGAQALNSWHDATKNPEEAPDPAIFKALEAASKQLNEDRKTGRAKILEEAALQRVPMATARAALETLAWADLTLYHSWRLTESLRLASSK